jgi:ABC-type polar amino acid transport system ATPase subunit
MSNPAIWVDDARFSDGTCLRFGRNDIVVMVGPNNCGKSESLRNIQSKVENTKSPSLVITGLSYKNSGTVVDLQQWLDSNARKTHHHQGDFHYVRGNATVQSNLLDHFWQKGTGVGQLSGFFCFRLSADQRLIASDPPNNIELTTAPFVHPIHHLQANDDLEALMSRLFRRSFGADLIVHRNAGSKVPLYCGEKPKIAVGEDRVSFSYLKALEQLPSVHTQGDGIRAFVGILLHALIMPHSILLIDEPEAFLHPPQVRQLARFIAHEIPNDRQIFIATHSGDFVRGIVEANQSRVRIIRLRRDGNKNYVHELRNDRLKELWSDPLLRYSTVLDGLFHEKTVVAEADADCRFYSAIKDSCASIDVPHKDVMFAHCGGKARFKVVVKALRGLGVPVNVIADFDFLNDEFPLHEVFEELGGEWKDIEKDWVILKKAVVAKQPQLASSKVKTDIQKILDGVNAVDFPKRSAEDIKAILKKASPWALAKEVGISYIPAGDATQAYERLDTALRAKGCYVVPCGELEAFDRTVGGHGPKWVNAVLEKDIKDAKFEPARNFVKMFL